MNTSIILLVCKDLLAGAPAEIQLIPAGYHSTPKGDFLFDEQAAALVLNALARKNNDMVIDYEHQTLEGCEAPAAGWIKTARVVNRGADGIWAEGVEWTDKAKQYIASKEYRYLSPVFLVRKSDKRVTALINVALTNQPNIDGMVPLINKAEHFLEAQAHKEGSGMKKLKQMLGLAETASEDDVCTAVNKLIQSGSKMANKALALLGLGGDADEAALEAAITTLQGNASVMANKDVLTALGLKPGATASEATATILAMKQGDLQTAQLLGRVKSLEEQLGKRDADDLVTTAINDGKITPAQKEWAVSYAKNDPEGFKLFVAKAPVVVQTHKVVKDDHGRQDAPEETQLQVNKLLGIDNETYQKHNKKEE